jgi:hypothetical protein
MPSGDRTGPMGQGPRTGRGLGYCSGSNVPGFMNSGFGRSFGVGFGRRFMNRARFLPIQQNTAQRLVPIVQNSQETVSEEKQFLEQELENLKQDMEDIEKRLKELKS